MEENLKNEELSLTETEESAETTQEEYSFFSEDYVPEPSTKWLKALYVILSIMAIGGLNSLLQLAASVAKAESTISLIGIIFSITVTAVKEFTTLFSVIFRYTKTGYKCLMLYFIFNAVDLLINTLSLFVLGADDSASTGILFIYYTLIGVWIFANMQYIHKRKEIFNKLKPTKSSKLKRR